MPKPPIPGNPTFDAAVRQHFAAQPLIGHLGAWLLDIAPGRVAIEVTHAARLSDRDGKFDPAVIATAAACAGACAALTLMPPDSAATTVDYTINHICPADSPVLHAVATVLRPGKSITVVRVDCHAGSAGRMQLCAVVQATYARQDRA